MANTEEIKKDLWDLGYNFFPNGPVGRLCFNSEWKGGVLKRWPGALPLNSSWYLNYFPYMDLYPYVDRGRDAVETLGGTCRKFEKSWLFPLQEIKVGDLKFLAPKEIEAVLIQIYGKDWRTPVKKNHGSVSSYNLCNSNLKEAKQYLSLRSSP